MNRFGVIKYYILHNNTVWQFHIASDYSLTWGSANPCILTWMCIERCGRTLKLMPFQLGRSYSFQFIPYEGKTRELKHFKNGLKLHFSSFFPFPNHVWCHPVNTYSAQPTNSTLEENLVHTHTQISQAHTHFTLKSYFEGHWWPIG